MNSIKAKNLSYSKLGKIADFIQSNPLSQSNIKVGLTYPVIISNMVDLCHLLDEIEAGKTSKRFKNQVADVLCYLGGEPVANQILSTPETELIDVLKTILYDLRNRLAEIEQSIVNHLGIEDSTDFIIEEDNKIIHVVNGKLVHYFSSFSTSDV